MKTQKIKIISTKCEYSDNIIEIETILRDKRILKSTIEFNRVGFQLTFGAKRFFVDNIEVDYWCVNRNDLEIIERD